MANTTDILFDIGLIFKGVDSLLEVIGGALLTTPNRIVRYMGVITQHEIFRHHQTLAGRLDNLAESVSMKASIGEASYLIVHGLAKVILIVAIMRGKRWGYTGLMVVLTIFTAIEVVRAVSAKEIFTGLFGLVDLFVVVLVGKEYKTRFGGVKTE